jgi:IS4 transposase
MDCETSRYVLVLAQKRLRLSPYGGIEVRSGKTWHSYLTSVLDPNVLPPYVVADLYRRRWRIEDAFNTVKILLGLSYLWTGSINGIKLQIWATWLFYAVLVGIRFWISTKELGEHH